MREKPKICFFGTSNFAIPIFTRLVQSGMAPVCVVSTPNKPMGRTLMHTPPPLASKAKKTFLPLLQPLAFDASFFSDLAHFSPRVGVLAAYGKIIPKQLIDFFQKGIINIHPSLLPKYRGPSPIQSTIIAGEKNTGVSLILLDDKIDHGPLVASAELKEDISRSSYMELEQKLAALGGELLIDMLPKYLSGTLVLQNQNHREATFTKMIAKENGNVRWNIDAQYIERTIRAYDPWPGSYTFFQKNILKIKKAEAIPLQGPREAGLVFEKDSFPVVACDKGALRLLVVQPAGKKEMPADAFLLGHREIINTILK